MAAINIEGRCSSASLVSGAIARAMSIVSTCGNESIVTGSLGLGLAATHSPSSPVVAPSYSSLTIFRRANQVVSSGGKVAIRA